MSSFVKKVVKVDENLSKVIGIKKGILVSYAEITKGVYDYIKKNNLKADREKPTPSKKIYCFKCGAEIERKVKFCDRCGVKF